MEILLSIIVSIVFAVLAAPIIYCITMPLFSILSIFYNCGVEGAYKLDKIKISLKTDSDAEAIAATAKRIAIMAIVSAILVIAYYILFARVIFALALGIVEIILAIVHLVIAARQKKLNIATQ